MLNSEPTGVVGVHTIGARVPIVGDFHFDTKPDVGVVGVVDWPVSTGDDNIVARARPLRGLRQIVGFAIAQFGRTDEARSCPQRPAYASRRSALGCPSLALVSCRPYCDGGDELTGVGNFHALQYRSSVPSSS